MSDQKYQPPHPPTEDSTGLPFKKRDFTETMSSNSSNDDLMFPTNQNIDLDELKEKAYYDVLMAFHAESSAISNQRILIVQELKKEWNIPINTHTAIEDNVKTDPLVTQLRKLNVATGQKIAAVEEKPSTLELNEIDIAPAKMPKEKAEPSSTLVDTSVVSWGQVSPKSLVGNWVSIRMPGEESYIAFHIQEYDAQTEMHHLVSSLSQDGFDDPCDWIDIRHIPGEDVIWINGHPGFPTRICFLNQGQTILHETSTAGKKRQLKEVGKTSSGIPIIKKLDKGKSIA